MAAPLTATAPKRGQRFTHSKILDEDHKPMEFVVTRVALGAVWYRPTAGGSGFYCPVEEFGRHCLSMAPPGSK